MIKTISTTKAPAAVGPYSQAKAVNGILYCAGQGGLIPETGKLAEGGVQAQAEQACKNVAALLEEAGTSFENVVEVTCFLDDMADFGAFNEIYAKYFVSKPARTCVAAKELPVNMLCEIKVIAAIED